jgi:hypothetical protein
MSLNGKLEYLFEAVRRGDYEGFLKLIGPDDINDTVHFGLNHDYAVCNGFNLLQIFVYGLEYRDSSSDIAGQIKVIKQLLDWKVDINAQNTRQTALYLAVDGQNTSIVRYLIENGANIRLSNNEPEELTILSLAWYAERDKDEDDSYKMSITEMPMVKMFMLKGARPDEFILKNNNDTYKANEPMLQFYQGILNAREITTLIIGIHKYKKSPLFLIPGKDCIFMIARAIYETRGDFNWIKNIFP